MVSRYRGLSTVDGSKFDDNDKAWREYEASVYEMS